MSGISCLVWFCFFQLKILMRLIVSKFFFQQGSTAARLVINSMKTENNSKVNPPESTQKDMLLKRRQEYLELKKIAEQLERVSCTFLSSFLVLLSI